jgi:hypothetical protein
LPRASFLDVFQENGEGPRDTAMTELSKMPCEASHDIFEKLCRRSSVTTQKIVIHFLLIKVPNFRPR